MATEYTYDDFDFEKPLEEWTKEEKTALMERVAEIDDDLAAILKGHSVDSDVSDWEAAA